MTTPTKYEERLNTIALKMLADAKAIVIDLEVELTAGEYHNSETCNSSLTVYGDAISVDLIEVVPVGEETHNGLYRLELYPVGKERQGETNFILFNGLDTALEVYLAMGESYIKHGCTLFS